MKILINITSHCLNIIFEEDEQTSGVKLHPVIIMMIYVLPVTVFVLRLFTSNILAPVLHSVDDIMMNYGLKLASKEYLSLPGGL